MHFVVNPYDNSNSLSNWYYTYMKVFWLKSSLSLIILFVAILKVSDKLSKQLHHELDGEFEKIIYHWRKNVFDHLQLNISKQSFKFFIGYLEIFSVIFLWGPLRRLSSLMLFCVMVGATITNYWLSAMYGAVLTTVLSFLFLYMATASDQIQ